MLGRSAGIDCVQTMLIDVPARLKHHVAAHLFPGLSHKKLFLPIIGTVPIIGTAKAPRCGGQDRLRLCSSNATWDATALCSSASRLSSSQLSPVFAGGWAQVREACR